MLYEHSECNKQRVQYLEAKGILSERQSIELLEILEAEIKNQEFIRNLAVKVLVGGTATVKDIEEQMRIIYENEKEFTNLIIHFLKCKNSQTLIQKK